MFEKYDNQKTIDKVQKMIESISPDLKITDCTSAWNSNIAITVGLAIKVKGNKEIINKLVAIGFKKGYKWLQRDSGMYWDVDEKGYYVQRLYMPLPEPPRKEGQR